MAKNNKPSKPRKPENPVDRAIASAGRKIDNANARIKRAQETFERVTAADRKVIETQTAVMKALKAGQSAAS